MELNGSEIECPGCGAVISRRLVACRSCWRSVPGVLKGELDRSQPGTVGRARVVGQMRAWLKSRPKP